MLKQMRAHPPHFGAAGTLRRRGHRSESGGATGTRRDLVPPTRGQPGPATRARSAPGQRSAGGPSALTAAPPALRLLCPRHAGPLRRCREKGGRAALLRVAFPDLASTVAEVGKPWPYAPRAAGTLRRGGAERRSTPGSALRAAESAGLGSGGAPPFVGGGGTALARPSPGAAPAPPPPGPGGAGGAPPAAPDKQRLVPQPRSRVPRVGPRRP